MVFLEKARGFIFNTAQNVGEKLDQTYERNTKQDKQTAKLISVVGRIVSALFLTGYLALGISSITSCSSFFLFVSILGCYLNYNSYRIFENILVLGESTARLFGEQKISKKILGQIWVKETLLKNTIQFDMVYDLGVWIENNNIENNR